MRHLGGLLFSAIAIAGTASAERVDVDVELVLMVDVSRSMTKDELEIQSRGYVAALNSDEVYAAIRSGPLQRVAMAYVEWAATPSTVVEWRLLETRDDIAEFAQEIVNDLDRRGRMTSISEALSLGLDMLESNDYEGLRKIIDVSGDGPNNHGALVTAARDAALARVIVINGLPIMIRERPNPSQPGLERQWYFEDLDLYYESCVIGGPGSFVMPVRNWTDFASTVRQKLVLELAFRPMREAIVPVNFRDPRNCLSGERMPRSSPQYWRTR